MNTTHASVDPREAALLVMDFQNGIVGRIGEPGPLLERVARAIAVARRHGVQVGYVRVAFTDEDVQSMPDRNKMKAFVTEAGGSMRSDSPTTAIHHALSPQPGDLVVRKTRVGPFTTTDLKAQLKARGITTLILAGISTSGVVLSTVREGADRDYRLLVLDDATADPDPAVHAFLIEKIFPRQADVIDTDELERTLAQR